MNDCVSGLVFWSKKVQNLLFKKETLFLTCFKLINVFEFPETLILQPHLEVQVDVFLPKEEPQNGSWKLLNFN